MPTTSCLKMSTRSIRDNAAPPAYRDATVGGAPVKSAGVGFTNLRTALGDARIHGAQTIPGLMPQTRHTPAHNRPHH